jgi:hypothetical protein
MVQVIHQHGLLDIFWIFSPMSLHSRRAADSTDTDIPSVTNDSARTEQLHRLFLPTLSQECESFLPRGISSHGLLKVAREFLELEPGMVLELFGRPNFEFLDSVRMSPDDQMERFPAVELRAVCCTAQQSLNGRDSPEEGGFSASAKRASYN